MFIIICAFYSFKGQIKWAPNRVNSKCAILFFLHENVWKKQNGAFGVYAIWSSLYLTQKDLWYYKYFKSFIMWWLLPPLYFNILSFISMFFRKYMHAIKISALFVWQEFYVFLCFIIYSRIVLLTYILWDGRIEKQKTFFFIIILKYTLSVKTFLIAA